jgi:hypothetical protein
MTRRTPILAGLLLAGSTWAEADESSVRPSLSVLGVSESVSGAADVPAGSFDRDLAVDVGAGLDGRTRSESGGFDWSAFALLQDPAREKTRGLFLAGRFRGAWAAGDGWRFRLDDSARFARREAPTLADFQRNEVSAGFEQVRGSGLAWGVRASDRRRAVPGDRKEGFNQQALLVSGTWGGAESQWRAESGPQHFSTSAAVGWRWLGSLEWAKRTGPWTTAVRAGISVPMSDGPPGTGGSGAAQAPPSPTPGPPTPSVTPTPEGPDVPTFEGSIPPEDKSSGDPPGPAPNEPGLIGPGIVIDLLEDDDTDWDFGRQRQDIVLVLGRSFGPRVTLGAEVRGSRERGPDLRAGAAAADVRRDRLAVRAHLRRTLGARWTVLLQGGWQRVTDSRPGQGYSRGVVSLGLELRP